MFRANLVVKVIEVAAHASISDRLVDLMERLISLADFLCKICDGLVKSWRTSSVNILLCCKDIVRGGQLRHLVFNTGKHITDSKVDTSSELVLVINKQPLC